MSKKEQMLKILPVIEKAIEEDLSEEQIAWRLKDTFEEMFFTEISPMAYKIHSMIGIMKENL